MTSAPKWFPHETPIPPSWTTVPLKYLTKLSNGFPFKSDTWEASGIPILRIENLNGSTYFNHSTITLGGRYQVQQGDLLFSWSGNPGTSFGPFLWSRPGPYYLNQHIFKVPAYGCSKKWLYWSLKAATHWIERELTSGMIGMVHVTKDELGSVPIPIPSSDEQDRISNFLDVETARIDRLHALQTAVLQKIDERDQAVRDSLVDDLIREVGALPLRRYILRIEQGSSPACESYPREPGEWGVIKLSAVKRGDFFPGENKKLPHDIEPTSYYEVRNGDLLVTRANTPELVGDVAVVRDAQPRLLLPDLIYRVVPSPQLDAKYAAEVLLSSRVRSLIRASARGTSQSMVKLRGEDIREWPIPNASAKQQAAFTSALMEQLSSSETLRNSINRQLALLIERRQSLITAAVTGQIDVSTARGLSEMDGVKV